MERRKINRQNNQPMDGNVLDVQDVFKQILRHKFLTLVLIAVPTALCFVYLVTRPDIYQSTATILLEENETKIANVEEAFPGLKFDPTTTETQISILRSPTLIREVIAALGLHLDGSRDLASSSLTSKDQKAAAVKPVDAKDPQKAAADDYATLSKYSQGLVTQAVKGSRIIQIGFVSENPYLSAEVANAHAKQYVDSRIDMKQKQAGQLNDWIAEQVDALKKQSTEKSTAVQKFRQENNMIKGRNSDDLVYQQVSDIAAQLVPVQAQKAQLQSQADAIAMGKEGSQLEAIQNSQVIQSLKTQAASARQELRALSAKYGKNHPLYVEAQRRVSQTEGDIARETASIKDTIENELKTVTAQEELLNEQLNTIKNEADTQRQKQIELEGLELEAAASSKLLDSFIARYGEISSQMDFARPDVRIVTDAEIPMSPVNQKTPLKMLVVLFLSTIFACVTVFLISFADRGVQSVDDVRKLLQLRFLGVLPDVRNPVDEVSNGTRSTYFEEIKRIYLHLSNKPSVKTLLITAASTGEGKTSMALALASYLTSLGRKVLVIDADMRTPDVARLAGVEDGPGLAEVLAGKVIASSAIRRDDRGVAILTAGAGKAGDDLLTSDGFRTLLDGLKGNYDYILVDSAPVLNSTDAETVAGSVDMVVMVVAYARTSRKNLKKAAETLRQFAPEMPSVILNKADLKNVA